MYPTQYSPHKKGRFNMGLDMYLFRYPNKGHSLETMNAVSEYFDLQEYKKEHPDYDGNLKEWCGLADSLVTSKALKDLAPFYTERYYAWDTAHKHPRKMVQEHVGYWRKENHIHNWFVQNVQDCMDDCRAYIVSCEQLKALRDVCQEVLSVAKTEPGVLASGTLCTSNGVEYISVDGLVITNPEKCAALLPTCNGFFFGDEQYDECYLNGVKDTIEIIDNVLATTDFDKQLICYQSSW
jgi:hypothetical protein